MQSMKKTFATRAVAWVLAFVMVFTMIPYGAFARGEAGEGKFEMAPAKGPVAVRDAAPPIESQVGNDSRNAVHVFVGVQTGGDVNLPLANATGQQFKPLEGVRGYFQWFEDGGYVSPIYTAVSDANGRLNIGCTPYLASDGKLIKFDADTTVSAGNERYKFWVEEDTIPKGYQLQYITGEGVVFPDFGLPITQGGSSSNTAKNTHDNWKILFMQKPKAEMHRSDAKETPVQSKSGGYMTGKVSWDYKSGVGGVHWYDIAQHTEGAKDVTVRASYLSDYAMKKIYSDEAVLALGGISKPEDIRGSKWTSKLEDGLQKWIKKQVEKEPDKWIAETVTAKTDAEGNYIIQFNGTWGYKQNAAVAQGYTEQAGKFGWSQQAIDRLGTVAENASDGSFADAAPNYNEKHINYDWLFVSTDGTENLRVMTPYNNNYYASMNSDWGIHAGWSGTGFGVGVTNALKRILRSDFVFGPGEIDFHITNYDNEANTAIPGDIAQTSTTGLPYSFTSNKYQIVWYGPDGKKINGKEGQAQQPSSTGTIDSAPFDTSGVTKTTEYTAKLHRVDSKGNLLDPIAIDSFTVEVSSYVGSRYDDFEHKNDNPIKGAAYSAVNLPEGLTIDAGNGNISGKPTKAGLYDVKVTASMEDTDQGKVVGKIEGSRTHKYLITDSPLAGGAKGTEYNQKVVPTPQKGYVFKNVSAKFITGKEIAGLTITGDQISGTPTAKVEATEQDPNVEVTYDVYRKNDKGEEVLIKKGHVDKVPLSIKDGESEKYEPEYKAVNGTVGTKATVAAPKFLDEKSTTEPKPEANPQPKGMTFALGEGAPEGAVVNADGSVTYTPKAADAGKPVNVPVVVTYADGSKDNATAVINVAEKTDAEKNDPQGQNISAKVGDKVKAEDGIKNKEDLTNVKSYTFKEPVDTSEAGEKDATVVVEYNDGTKDEVAIKVNVTEKTDADKPTITNGKAENDPEKTTTTVSGKTKPNTEVVVTDKDGNELGTVTSDDKGNFTAEVPKQDKGTKVTATPKDGTPSELTVTDKPAEPQPGDKATSVDDSNVKPVKPTNDPQDTGIDVKNPGTDTTVSAKDEDGKNVPAYIDNSGNVIVTPGKDVDGPITVTITDSDLPYGRKVIEVPVVGHRADRDDNGSNKGSTGGYWFIPANPTTPSVEKPSHETAIHKAYIYGYENGSFKPEGNMTRAEAAAMLARLQGLDLSNSARPNFIDVRSGWYNAAINAVVNAGYMKGYPDGTFRPNGKITRAEFAQMIKAIDKANTGMAPFADAKGHWAEAAINQAYANGRINGYPDGTFRPNNHITRAEAVKVFNKLYDRSVNLTGLRDVLTNIAPFVDVNASHWAYYEIVEASNTHTFYRTEKGQVGETWVMLNQTWKQASANR